STEIDAATAAAVAAFNSPGGFAGGRPRIPNSAAAAATQHMFHVNQSMHAAHIGRSDDPTSAAQFNSYLIMSRAQQQQQQQQPHHPIQHHPGQQQAGQPQDHLVGVAHQSPPVSAMALPPLTHGSSVLSTTRRLDELHLNQYHPTMNTWQM
ncbi:hypothetical protein LPJ53_005883, partial [Coemansia erecta]